jgi:hypothetical protein
MNQNYFEVNNASWQQQIGTFMGSTVSSILAEIFLQELEKKCYPNLIKTRHIKYISRYVDNVFIIYDEAGATAQEILQDHKNTHPRIKYNMEVEINEHMFFLTLLYVENLMK